MIRFQLLGIRFVLPLPMLLIPLLAKHLGLQPNMPGLLLALGIHESAHVLAARLTGVEITEIHILPFGGSAHMENPYGVSPVQLALTAIAGPVSNLLLALVMAALAQWRLVLPEIAAMHVQHNLVLMLFNLLPALPLDGGRILYALLQRPLGESIAQQIGIACGRILAVALVITAIWGGIRSGKWNLSFLLTAVFILSSEEQEHQALFRSRAQRLQTGLTHKRTRPARIYHMDEQQHLHQAIRLMRSWENTWFILTRDHLPCAMIDGQSLLQQIHSGAAADTPMCQLRTHPLESSPARA